MPPMTMVFQVKDPAMLEQVKPGDKVKFQAEKVGGETRSFATFFGTIRLYRTT